MYFLRFGWAAHWHQLKLNPDCGERRHICPSARGKKAQVQLKSRVEMLILGQRTSDSRDTLTLVQKSETRKASSRDADITESKAALALLQAGVWEAGKINKRAHTHIHTHEPRSHTLRAHTHTAFGLAHTDGRQRVMHTLGWSARWVPSAIFLCQGCLDLERR